MAYEPLSDSNTASTTPTTTGKGYIPLVPAPKSAAAPVASKPSGYQPISSVGLLTPKSSVAPVSTVAPTSSKAPGIPASALKGSLGGGYGASNELDKYSGKPELTFENQKAQSSQLFSDRVAPTFDPTVPQKIDPSVLHNGRMPEAASEAVRKATGAEPDEQLDHLISLELGGSNDTSNLNLEKTNSSGVQPSLALENLTAKQVASGQISYIDGQKIIARAKGVQLPDDTDFSSSTHPLAGGYPKPAPNQTGTQAQQPKSLASTVASSISTGTDPINQAGKALYSTIDNWLTQSAPVQLASKLQTEGFSKTVGDFFNNPTATTIPAAALKAYEQSTGTKVDTGSVPQTLDANDINDIISGRQKFLDQGLSSQNATIASTLAVRGTKIANTLNNAVSGMTGDEGDVSKLFDSIAESSDPAAIAKTLKNVPGVAAEDIPTLSKALKNVTDPKDVQSIIESVSEKPKAVEPANKISGEPNPNLTPEQSRSISDSGKEGAAAATWKDQAEQASIRERNAMEEKSAAAPPVPQDSFLQKLKNTINPLKQQDPETQKIFQDYTKKIAAARPLANDESKKLSDIPVQEGWDAILREERGQASPHTAAIKGEFQDLMDEGRSRGLDIPERQNYVPHSYSETPAEIKQVTKNYLLKKGVPEDQIDGFINGTQDIPDSTAKRLGLNPFFTKTRIFPTYEDAIGAGLHPKFTHPAQLAGLYRETMERNVANRELISDLVKGGKLFTSDLAPKGYQPVNLEFAQQGYYAKPRLAQMLNGLFHDGNSQTFMDRVTGFTGKLSSSVQKLELTTGVPGMNVNVHSIGQLIKGITAGDLSTVKSFIRSQSDKASVAFFEDNADVLKRMAAQNIDVGSTVADYAHMYPNMLKPSVADAYARGGAKSVASFLTKETGSSFEKTFTKKNFTSFMPATIVQTFKDASNHFVAQGMEPKEADALAADVVRAFHGLVGNVGRSKGTEAGLSTVFFAPQFRESIVNTLWNSLKSVTTDMSNPAFYKNRQLVAGMAITYGLYAGANKYLNGHYIWQNPSTHQFDLQIPTGNGNYAYVPFMPSFLAVPRNLVGGALSTAQGDLAGATQQFSSELSAPLQLFGQLYANKDFYGRAIYNNTDSGSVKAEKIASYLGLNVVPPFIKEAVNYIQKKGATPLYQSITTGMELPIKYGSDATNNTSDFYNALTNYDAMHAQALSAFKPTFDKIQQMIQSGQKDQATQLVNGLSDDDYTLYKDLKQGSSVASTTKAEAQFLPTYRTIRNLVQQGNTAQATQAVNNLSASDYKLYQSLKKKNIQ
jgi:hypothetical protein